MPVIPTYSNVQYLIRNECFTQVFSKSLHFFSSLKNMLKVYFDYPGLQF